MSKNEHPIRSKIETISGGVITSQTVAERPIVESALQTIETGPWPIKMLTAVAIAIETLRSEHDDIGFHHIGFLQPDRKSWEITTSGLAIPFIQNILVDPLGHKHYRKYVPINPDRSETAFIEYALAGDEGNGRYGVHYDLIHPKAAELLDKVRQILEPHTDADTKLLVSNFGGGTAPVGRVGIMTNRDGTNVDSGVMFRTHYSHPKNW